MIASPPAPAGQRRSTPPQLTLILCGITGPFCGKKSGVTTRSLLCALIAMVAVGALGCVTAYVPQSASPAVTRIGGAYVRDGKTFPHGLFGGGLVEAVACDERATKEARAYFRDLAIGIPASTLGGAMVITGGLATYGNARAGNAGAPAVYPVTLGLGVAALAAGVLFLVSAPPHERNAIDAYDEDHPAPCGR
jgi:hypothetical protein